MDRIRSSVAAATIIRLYTALASISLGAAGLSLIVQAPGLPRSFLPIITAVLTFIVGCLSFYASSLALGGRRKEAGIILGSILALLVLVPLVRYLPGLFDILYILNVETLFPPLWLYSIAIPLLLFVLLEIVLPVRREIEVPVLTLFAPIIASVFLLFFGVILIGGMVLGLLGFPASVFNSLGACIGLALLFILGAVLPRKGMVREGMLLLVLVGLVVEWLSIFFYWRAPNFVGLYGAQQELDHILPLVPVLGGTIPGALTALAGVPLVGKVIISKPIASG